MPTDGVVDGECQWVAVGEGVLRCAHCKQPDYKVPIRRSTGQPWPVHMIHRHCPVSTPKAEAVGVPTYRLWWNFAIAWFQHARHGFPVTPEHARAQRLAICNVCPFYKNKRCAKCGCGVKDEATWLDKLGWAEQQCPDNPPRWLRIKLPKKPWGERGERALAWLKGWLRYLSPYETL